MEYLTIIWLNGERIIIPLLIACLQDMLLNFLKYSLIIQSVQYQNFFKRLDIRQKENIKSIALQLVGKCV